MLKGHGCYISISSGNMPWSRNWPDRREDVRMANHDHDGKLWHVGGTMVKPALDINLAGRALDTEERGLVT